MDSTDSSDYTVIYAQVKMERDLCVGGTALPLCPCKALFPTTEFWGLVGFGLHGFWFYEGFCLFVLAPLEYSKLYPGKIISLNINSTFIHSGTNGPSFQ